MGNQRGLCKHLHKSGRLPVGGALCSFSSLGLGTQGSLCLAHQASLPATSPTPVPDPFKWLAHPYSSGLESQVDVSSSRKPPPTSSIPTHPSYCILLSAIVRLLGAMEVFVRCLE